MQPTEEIEDLLNELEQIVQEGRTPLMGGQGTKVVEEELVYEIIDEIRDRFPDEFREAKRVLREREEMFAQAQQQADNIINDAQQQAMILAGDQEVVRLAQQQADQIRAQAAQYERDTRYNAESYAESVLAHLEDSLKSMTSTVTRVRQTIEEGSSSQGDRAEW